MDPDLSVCTSVVWSWDTTITLVGISAVEFNGAAANTQAFRQAVFAIMGQGYELADVGTVLVVADSRRRRRLLTPGSRTMNSGGDGGDGGDGSRLLSSSQIDVTYGTSVAVDDDPDGDVVIAVQAQMSTALSSGDFNAALAVEASNTGASADLIGATSQGVPVFGPSSSEAQEYVVVNDDDDGGPIVNIDGLVLVFFFAVAVVAILVVVARKCDKMQQRTAAATRGRPAAGWNGGGGGGGGGERVFQAPHTHVQMVSPSAPVMAQAQVMQAVPVTY